MNKSKRVHLRIEGKKSLTVAALSELKELGCISAVCQLPRIGKKDKLQLNS